LTSNEELGADATSFFNAITGYSQPQRYRKIEAAPTACGRGSVELIEARPSASSRAAGLYHRQGQLPGRSRLIDALYAPRRPA
jgi:polyphosphate kinase